jgi:hypothetical protein
VRRTADDGKQIEYIFNLPAETIAHFKSRIAKRERGGQVLSGADDRS